MSEMINRMATAMRASKAWPAVFGAGTAEELACAALGALFEPTTAMIEAADIRDDEYYVTDPAAFVTEIWKNMLGGAIASQSRGTP